MITYEKSEFEDAREVKKEETGKEEEQENDYDIHDSFREAK